MTTKGDEEKIDRYFSSVFVIFRYSDFFYFRRVARSSGMHGTSMFAQPVNVRRQNGRIYARNVRQ